MELRQATGAYSARSSLPSAPGPGPPPPPPLASAQELQQQAKQQLAHYLQQARQQPGLEMADAVDTLLACLLCDVGDAEVLEQLVRQPTCLAARPALALMQASGRWHALALYRWGRCAAWHLLSCMALLHLWPHVAICTAAPLAPRSYMHCCTSGPT